MAAKKKDKNKKKTTPAKGKARRAPIPVGPAPKRGAMMPPGMGRLTMGGLSMGGY